MKKLKKIFHVLSSIILYSLLVILLVVSILFASYGVDQYIGASKGEERAPLFGAYVIISPSMVPNINVYDAVVTMRVSPEKIKLYDIITFLSGEINTNGTPITHRVVGIIDTESGEKAFRTKGDNNESEDRALIKQKEILGKVILRIPMVGYVKTFLTSKIGWLVAIVIPCVLIIGTDILKLLGIIKKKDEDESDNSKTDEEKKEELLEQIKEIEASEQVVLNSSDVDEIIQENVDNISINNNISNIDNSQNNDELSYFDNNVVIIPSNDENQNEEKKEEKVGDNNGIS